jgi:two-component system chemotaxis response regulator CheY
MSVDDSALIKVMVRRYLQDTEFSLVGVANDGLTAVAEALRLNPDIVLLDLVMPGASGQEVLGQLRNVVPNARVIIVSSIGSEDAVRECLAAGADNFLQKPFTREALLTVLRALPPDA